MPILTQKAMVLAKFETTPGVDAVPTAALNAFLVSDPQFSVDLTVLERNFARTDFSQYASKIGRRVAKLTFSIQIAGGGTAATSPAWAVLLRACGMVKSAVTGPAGEKWAPTTAILQDTVTLYCYYDGLLHKMLGCVGTYKITADAGSFSTVEFTMTGLYVTPASSTFPASPVFENVMPPQVELAQMAYGGDATLIAKAFTYDMGNNVVLREDVNSSNGFKQARISGRNPGGGLDPEVELAHTFWASLESSATAVFTMTLGATAGNKIKFDAPASQIVGIGYGDRDNLRNYDLSLMFRRGSAGDDEFTITFL
jgi:hypothetical protein